jgi:hypothetical protein
MSAIRDVMQMNIARAILLMGTICSSFTKLLFALAALYL